MTARWATQGSLVGTSSPTARPRSYSNCSSGGARRDLFLLFVGRQARGGTWPNAAEAGSRVPLDVVVEDVHQCSGGVAVKLDGDLIGVHPRQRIPRNALPLQTRQVGMRRTPLPEPRRQAGAVPRPPLPRNQGGSK